MSEPLTPRQKTIVLTLSAVIGLTRFVPLSVGPWDWDEVLFCIAVSSDYDVSIHHPHPPGFPLFVFLARLVRIVISSDFRALQAVNVVAGVLAFPVMFHAGRAFRFGFAASVCAGILFSFLPNVWFYGGTALSDLTGAVLFLAAVAAYLREPGNVRWYLVASVLLGAAILIRPQNALIVVFPWTVATLSLLRRRNLKALIAGAAIVGLISGAGYAIAALATGVAEYRQVVIDHSRYLNRDSISNPTRSSELQLLPLFLDPYSAGNVSLVINALALAGLVAGGRRPLRVALTFGPFFLFALFALNSTFVSRFALNYMAGIALLCIAGIEVIASLVPRAAMVVRSAAMLLIVGRLVTWVLPAFVEPRTSQPPPAAAALWLRDHAGRTSTIFTDSGSWPWGRYFLGGFKQVTVPGAAQVVEHSDAPQGWYLSVSSTPPEDAVVFRRPRHRLWNIVSQRGFEAFVQPAGQVVAFASGWYDPESGAAGSVWRWSSEKAEMRFPKRGGKHELRLLFTVPFSGRPVDVRFVFDGLEIGRIHTTTVEHDLRFLVNAREDRNSVLTVEVADPYVPAKHGYHDTRPLGIMLRSWSWRPVDSPGTSR